jgi:DNA-binding MarR family transcriptional regulator
MGTDAYFVKLTLSGRVIDKRMLATFKKIGDERLGGMTTEDYILLSKLFSDIRHEDIQPERFAHLVELKIVERTASGIKIADLEALSVANRSLSVAATDRKQAVIDFLKDNGQAKTRDLIDIVGLSDGRVRALLRTMVDDGVIEKVGDKRFASYRLKNTD